MFPYVYNENTDFVYRALRYEVIETAFAHRRDGNIL